MCCVVRRYSYDEIDDGWVFEKSACNVINSVIAAMGAWSRAGNDELSRHTRIRLFPLPFAIDLQGREPICCTYEKGIAPPRLPWLPIRQAPEKAWHQTPSVNEPPSYVLAIIFAPHKSSSLNVEALVSGLL